MIRYALKCDAGHVFDSWFKSADAFDGLQRAGHLSCPHCGSSDVNKSLMAPPVSKGGGTPAAEPAAIDTPVSAGIEPPPDLAEKIEAFRKDVEANSEYVGPAFARKARDMAAGIEPVKSIYGETKADEAKKLIEDGIPVAPLPFIPKRKTN